MSTDTEPSDDELIADLIDMARSYDGSASTRQRGLGAHSATSKLLSRAAAALNAGRSVALAETNDDELAIELRMHHKKSKSIQSVALSATDRGPVCKFKQPIPLRN